MPGRSLRVLVSGAGIAGATLACLLGRQGHEVTVVERDQGVRSSGNPVDVRGAAFDVVEDMGLAPRLSELATAVRRLVLVDASGRRVGSIRTRQSEQRELEILRADLCGVLVDAASVEADLRFGDSITGLRADERGVDATFERGAPARFDLVVGADGLHSTVRRLAFGPETDFVTHFGLYLATVPLAEPLDRDDTVIMYNQPGAAAALHPGRGLPGVGFIFRSTSTVDPRDTDASATLLRQVYADAGWRVPELLDTYLASTDTYFDAVSRVRLSTWSRERVTLLGDAASSVSIFGEGSSSAIAGAATLARALTRSGEDIPAALRRYETEHRAASSRGQRTARITSHLLIPATPPGPHGQKPRTPPHPAAMRAARRSASAPTEIGWCHSTGVAAYASLMPRPTRRRRPCMGRPRTRPLPRLALDDGEGIDVTRVLPGAPEAIPIQVLIRRKARDQRAV